jgi:hypothetical protein
LLQPLQERPDAGLKFRIVRGSGQEHADAPRSLGLLRFRRERPGDRRAAEQRDEIAAPYVGHRASSRLAAAGRSTARSACHRWAGNVLGQT